MTQEHAQFSTEVDEIIADITAVWDELNDRSAELEHLPTNGNDNNVFDQSINMISDHVCNFETALVEEKIPGNLTTAKCLNSLKEHMVHIYSCRNHMHNYVYTYAELKITI